MKHIKWIILGLIISINLSAQTKNRIIQLSGTLSDKYPIKMTLTLNGNEVLGFYFYEKYKSKILLEGQIKGDKITLNESPDIDSEFSIGFIGTLKSDSFFGIWTDKYKKRTLNFKAHIDSDNLIIVPNTIAHIQGTYTNIYSSNDFISSVNLKYITDNLFCFQISNGTEFGCVGYVKGLIKLTDLNKGNYSGDSCEKLTFSLLTNELTIIEKNCDLHGIRCPFDGKYKKK